MKTYTLNTYDAVMLLENDEHATEEEMIEAMQSLIDSGVVWSLQGAYGRAAQRMIEEGICTPKEH